MRKMHWFICITGVIISYIESFELEHFDWPDVYSSGAKALSFNLDLDKIKALWTDIAGDIDSLSFQMNFNTCQLISKRNVSNVQRPWTELSSFVSSTWPKCFGS